MSYLLDTCVLTEFARQQPDPQVLNWMQRVDRDGLYMSVISVGEIQRGIERLPDSTRKDQLLDWVYHGLLERLKDHILPLDTVTLTLWGSLTAWKETNGQPMGTLESLIAASALRHNLILATRYVKEYFRSGVQIVNPWEPRY
jgi:predicted nucleic acid-binding protein